MAAIRNTRLSIGRKDRSGRYPVTVICTVTFLPRELAWMKEKLNYILKSEIWGDDLFFDDYLFPLGYTVFGKGGTEPSENNPVKFSQAVPPRMLDEDWGQDEIYAKLKLTNTDTKESVVKRTNIIRTTIQL